MNPVLPRRWRVAIVSGAAFSFLCKILLALNTFGTNDVYAWERFARWSALFGSRLYSIDPAFNHPPSTIHALAAMTWLARTTGVFFPFWLRLPAILADAASLWLVYRIFESRLDEKLVRWGLLLLALSPTLVLVSGFHGNTDSAVIFFVLLSVWLTERAAPDWQSGAAFGAAMCVKVFPLIVLPVLFFARPGLRRRAVYLGSAGVVMLLAWSPYVFRDPAAIFHQVAGYQSIYGHWGLTWLAAWRLPAFPDSWHDAFQHDGAWVALALIAAGAWLANRMPAKRSVYAQTGAAFFFFLAVANGFGVQYLAWLVPWTIGIALLPAAFFTLASGAFLFAVYNFWSGGFPWYLADSNFVGDFVPHLDYLLALCWLSVIALAVAVWRRSPSFPPRRIQLLFSALALLLFAWPLWNQVMNVDARRYPASHDRAALKGIRAGEDAMLSQAYYKMGRYQDAVVAARTGIALDPASLEAWDSLALASIRLGRRDEALNAVSVAIQLSPEDETANAVRAAIPGAAGAQ